MTSRVLVLTFTVAGMAWPALAGSPLVFDRMKISDVTYESAAAADFNLDGKLDIVCGEYWFEGPAFTTRHKLATIKRVEDYYDDFANFPMDVNGDRRPDLIVGGWWGMTLRWRENIGGEQEWPAHDIDKTGNVETVRFWDVDGDGVVEACPNAGGNVVAYRLVMARGKQPAGRFEKHMIKQGGCGHGLGFGDLNGDGKGDFIVPDGWLEQPANPWKDPWTWHDEFKLGSASVPILVYDVNGDKLNDMIVGSAHDYGLWWYEQKKDGDRRAWIRHDIETDRSQYHELMLADLDKDGKVELVTGKRFRAHQWIDPGSKDPLGMYYYKIDGGKFTRYTIDYGPAGQASGAGIYLWAADLDGNSWPDIICPGKDGLYVFFNRGPLDKLTPSGTPVAHTTVAAPRQ